jgi:uncharacterized protein YndB with AHSA1/START domain
MSLRPIERSISVSWSPDAAFKRFTADIMSWWPYQTHSVGGPRVKRVVFEQHVGGKFYEEHADGRRFQWGEVLEWNPPHRVKFTFHPSKDPSTAQDVELFFRPEGTGTRLTLVASKWENLGRAAKRARKGYDVGWGYVLNVWAGRRDSKMAMMDVVTAVIQPIQLLWHGGREGLIRSSKGELLRTE